MVLDVWYNATNVFNHMARLLSHPLQRPLAIDEDHSLLTSNDNQQGTGNNDNTEIDH